MAESSLQGFLFRWYRSLGLVRKVVYPLLAVALYLASVVLLVGIYWLKTDMGYNMITHGGWHAFSKCMATELQITYK